MTRLANPPRVAGRRLSLAVVCAVIAVRIPLAAAASEFVSGSAADLVLGQASFSENVAALGGSTGFRGAAGVAVDPVSGKVFVSDRVDNRILRFASADALVSGGAAEAVFGQPDFDSHAGATSQTGLRLPCGLFVDGLGRLWVADQGNSRVLMWASAASLGSGAPADLVLGQDTFDSATSSANPPTAASLASPAGIFVDANDTLWVADSGDLRVLRFANVSAKTNGADADGVLGKPDLVSRGAADASATSIGLPTGLAGDALGNLYVADGLNNRVLRFDNASSLLDGSAAAAVFGQADFTTGDYDTTAATLNQPFALAVDATGALWIADTLNRRVLRFDSPATAMAAPKADLVLGKPNFTTDSGQLGAALLATPTGLSLDTSGNLWVADCDNSRVLRFSPREIPLPTISARDRLNIVQSGATIQLNGRASNADAVIFQRGGDISHPAQREERLASFDGRAWSFRVHIPRRRLTVKVWALGPGGRSETLTFVLRREGK